jgi:hypothetical protein
LQNNKQEVLEKWKNILNTITINARIFVVEREVILTGPAKTK